MSLYAEALEQIADPLERLRALARFRRAVADLDEHLVGIARETITAARAHDPRPTWAEIGACLGVSAQRAEQLSKPTTPTPERTQP